MIASTFIGRAGIVVVDVVVVSPGNVLLVVVVVEVVVVTPGASVVVTTLVGAGQDCVAFMGRRTAGAVFSGISVVDVIALSVGRVASVCGGSVSKGTSASVSTGATAGGSSCIQTSS
jgi:hypothetical protein